MVYIAIFSTVLGGLVNYNQFEDYGSNWHLWVIAGLAIGLLFSLFGSFLDYIILNKRKKIINGTYFQEIKNHFSLQNHSHLLAGFYNQYLISIGWNTLPVGKTPKPGVFIFLVFKPVKSDKLFEIKKLVKKTDKLMVESFYIYQLIQVTHLNEYPLEKIESLIKKNIRLVEKYSEPPSHDTCINCQKNIERGTFKIINDIPVPICPSCVRKVG